MRPTPIMSDSSPPSSTLPTLELSKQIIAAPVILPPIPPPKAPLLLVESQTKVVTEMVLMKIVQDVGVGLSTLSSVRFDISPIIIMISGMRSCVVEANDAKFGFG